MKRQLTTNAFQLHHIIKILIFGVQLRPVALSHELLDANRIGSDQDIFCQRFDELIVLKFSAAIVGFGASRQNLDAAEFLQLSQPNNPQHACLKSPPHRSTRPGKSAAE